MPNYAELLAINVRFLMESANLTQADFGKKVGLDQPVISKILRSEMVNPTLKTLESISSPFKKTAIWLLTDHNQTINITPHDALKILQKTVDEHAVMSLKLARIKGETIQGPSIELELESKLAKQSPADPLIPTESFSIDDDTIDDENFFRKFAKEATPQVRRAIRREIINSWRGRLNKPKGSSSSSTG